MELLIILVLVVPVAVFVGLIIRVLILGSEVGRLSRRVERLEQEVGRMAVGKVPLRETVPAPTRTEAVAPIVPPPFPSVEPTKPVPVEPTIPPRVAPVAEVVSSPLRIVPVPTWPTETAKRVEPEPVATEIPEVASAAESDEGSIEMRVGTYWLVRVGVVMLLTGLAFFGNYAYHHIVSQFGPGGKVSLMYLFSAALLGAGVWWQRRQEQHNLRNYGQVLFAGGLAAVYFTTYAAYHIPALQVIHSMALDGFLLLLWAGVIVGLANWRNSEVLAMFGVGLGFYSSIITPTGDFTLWSNLVLTLAAIGFLLRNRWVNLSFIGLLASYGGYAYWRVGGELLGNGQNTDHDRLTGLLFLGAYWCIFTVAVFLSKGDGLTGKNRIAFLSVNNTALFTLYLLTSRRENQGSLWEYCLTYGAVLLGLSIPARRWLAEEAGAAAAYLLQGLLLVTLGFILKFGGWHLALILAVESVMLYFVGGLRGSRLMQCFGGAAALMATGWELASLERWNHTEMLAGLAVGGLLTVNAVFARRESAEDTRLMRPWPTGFAALALLNWLAAAWFNTNGDQLPLVLAGAAILCTASIYILKVRELALLGQAPLILAQLAELDRLTNNQSLPPWLNPLIVIATTLLMSHWWQRQKTLPTNARIVLVCQTVFAVALVALVLAWSHPAMGASMWLVFTALIALGATGYGVATRFWPLAVFGQIFIVVSVWQFCVQVWTSKPEWYFPLMPVAVLGILAFAAAQWCRRQSDDSDHQPVLQVAVVYWWTALVLSVCWLWQYIPERERVWVAALAALVVFIWAVARRQPAALLGAAAYGFMACFCLWAEHGGESMNPDWPGLLALLLLFALQQGTRRWADRLEVSESAQVVTVAVLGLTLWRWVSCWAGAWPGGFLLTITWAGLALVVFVAGMVRKERLYRWLGLGLLAAAVARVVLVDVWKAETIYRVLTLMGLGLALVVIGFLYNKYQETIRRWL